MIRAEENAPRHGVLATSPPEEVEAIRELMRDIVEECGVAFENRSEATRRLLRIGLFERWLIQGRKDLSARYLREALGRRRRALEAYLARA